MVRYATSRVLSPDFTERDVSRLLRGQFQLEEFFNGEDLDTLLAIATRRIIGTFVHERELARGKQRSTDNYIARAGRRQSELANYVVRHMRGRVIDNRVSLPRSLQRLRDRDLVRVLRLFDEALVRQQLALMCAKPHFDIYYNEMYGLWQITQSAVDTWRMSASRERPSFKRDDRSFHGRHRGQSARRSTPPGVSVGMAW